jgi:nucleotide-binding universal stress UspA family protein
VTGRLLDGSFQPVATRNATDVRPVMLLTLNVPLDEAAVAYALDTVVETGAELYICDAIPIAIGNPAVHVARSFAERDTRRELDEVGAQARSLGVRVTQMVFHNPMPISASLDVIRDNAVGLVVFGPDRRRLGRWSFRRSARRLREGASCFVWTNE